MKYHIRELIDAEKVQKLMERFCEMTKIFCTLIDPEGNILLEPPDIDYFRKQADDYGYDVETYLDALREVPVLDRHTVVDV